MHLVITEVTGIQPYIFGSNRMRENIGASFLVSEATETWAMEAICELLPGKTNLAEGNALDSRKKIEEAPLNLDAEVLYAAGGNFVALFREAEPACHFVRRLSRKVLTDAPGLQLVVAREHFQWSDSLSQKVKAALENLEAKKRAWIPSAPLLGLGVTVMCRSTGLPAVDYSPLVAPDEPRYPVSAEILAKLNSGELARRRIRANIPLPEGYIYPQMLDQLGRSKGEFSHLAVVHIDGNDMGERKKKIGSVYPNSGQNRDYINAVRDFSEQVKAASAEAMKQTVQKLVDRLKENGGSAIILNAEDETGLPVELANVSLSPAENGKHYLPFLPIVYGGDEVTFICDGRLGLSLATAFMRAFEQETENRLGCLGQVTSCAGITIVKSHYPFAQAYSLAEELCKSAKKYRHQKELDCSCLDWHFAVGGFCGGIATIREREYEVEQGSLTLRPVTLGDNAKEAERAWPVVQNGVAAFRKPDWIGRRNKIKALREALREGGDIVEQFKIKYGIELLPCIETAMSGWPERGWHGIYCGYFDAIELLDWHIPLEEDAL